VRFSGVGLGGLIGPSGGASILIFGGKLQISGGSRKR